MTKKNFKVLILTCWALLLICLVIKLFGGNWFELNSENTKFIQFCNYVDNTMWLKMILACLIFIFTTLPVICMLYNVKKLSTKMLLIHIPIMIFKSIINWYIVWLGYIIDLIYLIILPIILTRNWKRVLLVNVLAFATQLLTILIRSMSINFNFGNTFLEQALYQIDYYIMILLLYLYNTYFIIKKE